MKKNMLWFLAIIIIFIGTFNLIAFIISSPKYHGPVTDHFDGKVFINPGNVKAKGAKDLVKWMSTRKKQPWNPAMNQAYGPKPAGRIEDGITITFVNHSTFLIQVEGLNILTDPIWSDRTSPVSFAGPKRMRPPGIMFEDLPPIDIILISHNHYDHLDVPTIKRLIGMFHPRIITPLGVGAFIEKFGAGSTKDMDWWQEFRLSDRLEIACVPAQHFSGRGTFDRDATLWCGYVLKAKSGNIYFAGDSGYGDFFKEIGNRYPGISASLIPIGAYVPAWFMSPIHISPEEAVKVHQDVGSQLSIGMHFGTFPLADDGQQQPIDDLTAAIKKYNLNPENFIVLKEGESVAL
jgi:L-ascorbate metabolism protein UlaG (beta-lactamase superfamily)